MAKRLGKDTIDKFFKRIDERSDKDKVYASLLYNIIHTIKKDGVTFVLSIDGKNVIYVSDVRDRIIILKILKEYFLVMEMYEVLSDIDIMIKTHQEVLDEYNDGKKGNDHQT